MRRSAFVQALHLDRLGIGSSKDIAFGWIIALGTLAMLLPLILLGVSVLNSWIERQQAEQRDNVRAHAIALARVLDRELKGYIDTAEVLAGSRHLELEDIEVMDELARDAAHKTDGNFVLFDRSFKQLINTRSKPGTPLPVTENQGAVRRAFESESPVVADVIMGSFSKQLQFAIHVPVRVGNEVRYVLAYAPNQSALSSVLADTLRPDGWFAALIDGTGILVARSSRSEDFIGSMASQALLEFANKQGGVTDSVDKEGRASITAYQRSSLCNWRAVVWVPKAVLAGPQRRALGLMLAVCALALTLSLACAWVLTRSIGKVAAMLAKASDDLGAGKAVLVKPTIVREANSIVEAMSVASKLIAQRGRELQESEARLRLALEGANAGAWEVDLGRDRLIYTSEFAALCGIGTSAGEVATTAWLESSVHPDDRRRVNEAVSAALNGKADRVQVEFRAVLSEGQTRWLAAMGQIQRDDTIALRIRGLAIDISSRKAADEATARLATIVDFSNDAIISKTTAGIVTTWNAAAERMFGYAPEEIIGKSVRLLIPAERQSEEDQILKQIAAGISIPPFDTVRLHKSKRPIDVSVTISPILDQTGRVIGASKIVRDITERKAAAEKVAVLMREVSHRSKNMLSLAQAIARQTAATGADDFVARFTSRLQSLSANQDLLISNDWSGVGVRELATTQLSLFKDLNGTRLRIAGPELELTAAAAQSIGMALYELATNASKYGAMSTADGKLDLSWQVDGDTFEMHWVEQGGPPVQPPKHNGFGSTVIKELAQRGVGGTVTLDYAPTGLRWHLSCPVENVMTWRQKPKPAPRTRPAPAA